MFCLQYLLRNGRFSRSCVISDFLNVLRHLPACLIYLVLLFSLPLHMSAKLHAPRTTLLRLRFNFFWISRSA